MSKGKKQILLVTVVDREISTELFSSFEKAKEELIKQFLEYVTDANAFNIKITSFFGTEYGWDETSAYVNDGPNHSDYDWKIVEIPGT